MLLWLNHKKKTQAMKMRNSGMTISDIAKELSVSKGSVSLWCRDVILTKNQKENIHNAMVRAGHKGRMIGAQMNKDKRLKRESYWQERGIKLYKNISKSQLMMLGLGLYWGEGFKAAITSTGFANSDPGMIVIIAKWFRECMDVDSQRFILRLYVNQAHVQREQELLRFWSDLLELPLSQFRKTVVVNVQNKKVFDNPLSYKGVLQLRVSKGTDLKYRILGMIEGIKTSMPG